MEDGSNESSAAQPSEQLSEGTGLAEPLSEGTGLAEPEAGPRIIVGIGASAGGLEAFQKFFAHMPPSSGMGFVLVQHLDPHHASLMPELLGRSTRMPVQQARDGIRVEPNQVYVIPPNATLTISGGMLCVVPPTEPRGHRMPIDRFFRALAEDQGEKAVCIVLSGAGSDGALGLQTVKQLGGMTMAQASESARYDSMPRAAVSTGLVDHVLPVEQMPRRLMDYRSFLLGIDAGGGAGEASAETAERLEEICAILRDRTGHDFSRYKQSTLVRRIERRWHLLRIDSVSDYLQLLQSSTDESGELFKDLLISVTHFFRDTEAFEALAAEVVPRLFEARDPEATVRVWVAGCASGEEAYSLAMLLREHMEGLDRSAPRAQIFATDIDLRALEIARQGWYPASIADHVSPPRLARYFSRVADGFQVSSELREMCIFSPHNLTKDPPFSRLDLVSCRNLIIYLENELQRRVLAVLHYALAPGGFLFLGPAENVTSQADLFQPLDKRHRIFRRKNTTLAPALRLPLLRPGRIASMPGEMPVRVAGRMEALGRTVDRVVLEQYAPPTVVVNERGETVYFSGATGRYLEQPSGAPTVSLLNLARRDLRLALRSVMHQAMTSRQQSVQEGVAVDVGGKVQRINVIVRPLPETVEEATLFLVVFQEVGAPMTREQAEADGALPRTESAIVEQLENDLRAAKQSLHTTVEELETSNEELFSMNEELQSSNEELQTSKEELQSINEELETLNVELRKKIEELNSANADLQNLFQSTQIASVFLDRELKIQRFTPASAEVFSLIEGDVGRPISDISPRFTGVELLEQIHEVLRTAAPREAQVLVDGGKAAFILRVLPYRRLSGETAGVVLTFSDVTELRRASAALEEANRRKDEFLAMLAHELRNPLAPIRNCLHLVQLPGGQEHIKSALEMMERQVLHLSRLVDDLLDVSRISQGKILLRRERLDLGEVVRTTAEDNRGLLEDGGLRLSLHLPAEPLWISGDDVRLSQAVNNLLRNAGKFTDSGGEVIVTLRADQRAGQAVLSICDTGIGIAPEMLGRLFQPFSQGEQSLDRSRGGLGLGLATVKGLVELHGGSVEARSDGVGCGAELEVRLPLERRAVAPRAAGPPPGEPWPRRVLVIEDNLDALESLRRLLLLKGHEVEVARDGRTGLETAEKFLPDVVLCDIGLPGGLDGYEVAREMRGHPELEGIVLVALTGYGQAEDRHRAEEAGFDHHVTKPADPAALERLLMSPARPAAT
jgi:two-component system, chemotaxis family, CheB/CheR fusion protein